MHASRKRRCCKRLRSRVPHSRSSLKGLRISIPSPRKLFIAIFLPFWLAFWVWGGFEVGTKAAHRHSVDLFDCVWLCFWAVGTIFAAYAWLWNLFGRIELTVRPDALTLRQRIFGISRARTFATANMFNLRFVAESGSGKGRRASHIAFDCGAKTIKFAGEIEESEGNMIIDKVRERATFQSLPSYTEI